MPTIPSPEPDGLGEKVDHLAESVEGLREDQRENKRVQKENTAAQQEATRVLLEKQSKADRALLATQRLARTTRRQGAALVVLVALFLGWQWWDNRQADQDAVDTAVTNCVNTNVARSERELRDEQIPTIVFDVLNEITPAPTPDEKARRDVLIAQAIARAKQKLRDTLSPALQQRDCSEKAVTSPTVIATTTTMGQPG